MNNQVAGYPRDLSKVTIAQARSEPDSKTRPAGTSAQGCGRTLTLDLGTETGWAVLVGGEILQSGTLVLATEKELRRQLKNGRERSEDLRFARLTEFILSKVDDGVSRIVFEDVIFAGSRAQTQLWASLRAAIWATALQHPVEVFCVPVATLKVFACSNGRARKPEMALALAGLRPEHYTLNDTTGTLISQGRALDDNEVDAVWLALYTRAVDIGEEAFLGVHQRKAVKRAARREKRHQIKARKMARLRALRAEKRNKMSPRIAARRPAKSSRVIRRSAP